METVRKERAIIWAKGKRQGWNTHGRKFQMRHGSLELFTTVGLSTSLTVAVALLHCFNIGIMG